MKTIEEYGKIAEENFTKGMNCHQAVLCTFVDDLGEKVCGINHETAMKLGASFGAGMGRLREVCGAVSAMFSVAGLLWGYDENSPSEAKGEHYELIQELAAEFTKENGNIVCRKLLGLDTTGADSPTPEKRTTEYYKKRPCKLLVGDAAKIIASKIIERL
jgi:C_GCAxxG_C_C family probable redox protein